MPVVEPSHLFYRISKAAGVEDTTCREDFLTECLAAALAEDEALARAFAVHLAGPVAPMNGGSEWRVQVETQVNHPGACLDLVLRMTTGAAIAVEI
jgi:hypothetical protein